MATTVTTPKLAENIKAAARSAALYRSDGRSGKASGAYLFKYARTLTASEVGDFNAAGDFLEIAVLPANTYLKSVKATVPEMDTGVDQITLDLMLDSTVLVNDSTAGQAGGDIDYVAASILAAGGKTLKLKIETVANGIPTSYGAFTFHFELYFGAPTNL